MRIGSKNSLLFTYNLSLPAPILAFGNLIFRNYEIGSLREGHSWAQIYQERLTLSKTRFSSHYVGHRHSGVDYIDKRIVRNVWWNFNAKQKWKWYVCFISLPVYISELHPLMPASLPPPLPHWVLMLLWPGTKVWGREGGVLSLDTRPDQQREIKVVSSLRCPN